MARDGESEIVKILKTMPRVQGWATLIGCFDGDQRQQHGALNLQWPHVFLPGIEAPDQLLRNIFRSLNQVAVALELRVDRQDLLVSIASAAGIDFHDWARSVAAALNMEQSYFIKGVTKVWILEEDAAARQFVADVKQALEQL